MAQVEISVKVFERETKTDKKKFNTYKAVQKNGTFIDLKFRKEVVPPKKDCIIVVEEENMNIDNNRLYPCLWVTEIEAFKDIEKEKRVDPKVKDLF